MESKYEIPDTEQGLLDFIKYGGEKITRCEKKCKRLVGAIDACRQKLLLLGIMPGVKEPVHV